MIVRFYLLEKKEIGISTLNGAPIGKFVTLSEGKKISWEAFLAQYTKDYT